MDENSKETQLRYLHREIGERLKSLRSSIEYYRKRHYRYQTSAVVLAAMITILSGLKLPFIKIASMEAVSTILTDTVLALGAISTVVAAFGSFFSPQQSWYLYDATSGQLRALQAEIEMDERSRTFPEREDAAVQAFFVRYQAIMAEHNRQWQALRQKSK
jgi:hypothetical protein